MRGARAPPASTRCAVLLFFARFFQSVVSASRQKRLETRRYESDRVMPDGRGMQMVRRRPPARQGVQHATTPRKTARDWLGHGNAKMSGLTDETIVVVGAAARFCDASRPALDLFAIRKEDRTGPWSNLSRARQASGVAAEQSASSSGLGPRRRSSRPVLEPWDGEGVLLLRGLPCASGGGIGCACGGNRQGCCEAVDDLAAPRGRRPTVCLPLPASSAVGLIAELVAQLAEAGALGEVVESPRRSASTHCPARRRTACRGSRSEHQPDGRRREPRDALEEHDGTQRTAVAVAGHGPPRRAKSSVRVSDLGRRAGGEGS